MDTQFGLTPPGQDRIFLRKNKSTDETAEVISCWAGVLISTLAANEAKQTTHRLHKMSVRDNPAYPFRRPYSIVAASWYGVVDATANPLLQKLNTVPAVSAHRLDFDESLGDASEFLLFGELYSVLVLLQDTKSRCAV